MGEGRRFRHPVRPAARRTLRREASPRQAGGLGTHIGGNFDGLGVDLNGTLILDPPGWNAPPQALKRLYGVHELAMRRRKQRVDILPSLKVLGFWLQSVAADKSVLCHLSTLVRCPDQGDTASRTSRIVFYSSPPDPEAERRANLVAELARVRQNGRSNSIPLSHYRPPSQKRK
jgi:hypothetical protein